MGYSFNDANGYLESGPSINGLREVKVLVASTSGHPAIEQLLEHGHTNLLPALSVECGNLAKHTLDKDVKHTLVKLGAVARKAEEVVILAH